MRHRLVPSPAQVVSEHWLEIGLNLRVQLAGFDQDYLLPAPAMGRPGGGAA